VGVGADQGDEVGRVNGTPAGLCGFDELERHRYTGGPGAGSLGDPLPEPHGGEGRLDGVGGAQVDPVLGGVVVEGQQDVEVIGDLRGSFGPLGSVEVLERLGGLQGVVAVLGVVDLGQCGLRAGMRRLRERGKNIAADVKPLGFKVVFRAGRYAFLSCDSGKYRRRAGVAGRGTADGALFLVQ
jgi:hypothetical protein